MLRLIIESFTCLSRNLMNFLGNFLPPKVITFNNIPFENVLALSLMVNFFFWPEALLVPDQSKSYARLKGQAALAP